MGALCCMMLDIDLSEKESIRCFIGFKSNYEGGSGYDFFEKVPSKTLRVVPWSKLRGCCDDLARVPANQGGPSSLACAFVQCPAIETVREQTKTREQLAFEDRKTSEQKVGR